MISKYEYIVWGKAQNSEYEEPLYTKATSMAHAMQMKSLIESKLGAIDCRIQVLDLTVQPDFVSVINN